MAHSIYFYKCTADPNVVDKGSSLQLLGSAEILRPVHQVSVVKPVCSVDYNAALINANYCYIDTFGRWYFCSVATDTAQRMTISCSVDVLYTYRNAIKAAPATIIRQAAGSSYVVDSNLPVDPKRFFYDGKKVAVLNANTGLNYFVAINGG